MKKIFITGGHGQVAYELVQLLTGTPTKFFAPSREELDITDAVAVNNAITHIKPDAVINAAAYTKVDAAEKETQHAYAVNCDGAYHLALACAKMHCPLIHISTDYIFDGLETTPYTETSEAKPLNVYGLSKHQGEIAVLENHDNSIILRVSGVFGVHGNNFVKTILRLAKEREMLRIISDQTMCPTPAKAIANTILQMLSNFHRGIYHYCGDQPTNWYAFTNTIIQKALEAKYTLSVKKIEAIATSEYPAAAKRPPYSVLNCQKIANTFGIIQPDWKHGLTDVINQLSIGNEY